MNIKNNLFKQRYWLLFLIKKIFSLWRKPLNKQQTITLLSKHIVNQHQSHAIKSSSYQSIISGDDRSQLNLNVLKRNFNDNFISFEPDYVWKISQNEDKLKLQICSSGHPLINNKLILDLDYGTIGALKDLPVKFRQYNCELAIAPWSHNFGGYYAFLLLIMTKLCRIEAVFGRDIWNRAKICYPLLHTSYEQQYLQKLGISEEVLVDTRQLWTKIKPKNLILANNQSEINRISPTDIQLLRQRFLSDRIDSNKRKNRKIFLSRRNRRVLINEAEVRNLLTEYNIEIIEDTNYTVDEQIDLFISASVILAVHGAGLSNLVWCAPKTKVIELFYSGYTKPGFYYLSLVLNLEYVCLFDKSEAEDNFAHQYFNLEIDLQLLRQLLDKVLSI